MNLRDSLLPEETQFDNIRNDELVEQEQLNVYFFESDSFRAQSHIQVLIQIGITPKYFSRSDDLLEMARLDPPHFVITSFDSSAENSDLPTGLISKIENFFDELREISSEIFSLIIAPSQIIPFIIQNKDRFNLSDYLSLPINSLSEFAFRVQQASEKILRYFTSMQEKEKFLGESSSNLLAGNRNEKRLFAELSLFINSNLECKDRDDLVKTFLLFTSKITKNKPALFLKFMENKNSYVVHQSHWIDIEKFRGIGFEKTEESVHESLKKLMERVFFQKKYSVFSLTEDKKPQGLFVLFDDLKEDLLY